MFGVKDDQILVFWFDNNENMAIKSYSEHKVQKEPQIEQLETRRSYESDEINEQSIHRTQEKVQIAFATSVKELFKNTTMKEEGLQEETEYLAKDLVCFDRPENCDLKRVWCKKKSACLSADKSMVYVLYAVDGFSWIYQFKFESDGSLSSMGNPSLVPCKIGLKIYSLND